MLLETEKFECRSETERLVIRPLEEEDYGNWLDGFESRGASKHVHDPGGSTCANVRENGSADW